MYCWGFQKIDNVAETRNEFEDRKEPRTWSRNTFVCIPDLCVAFCMGLGNPSDFSKPRGLHVWKGDNKITVVQM